MVFHVICKYAFEVIAKVRRVCCDKNDAGSTICEKSARHATGSEKSWFDINLPEDMFAKRVDFVPRDFLTNRFKNRGMGDHHRGHLIVHHLLSLLIQRHAFVDRLSILPRR